MIRSIQLLLHTLSRTRTHPHAHARACVLSFFFCWQGPVLLQPTCSNRKHKHAPTQEHRLFSTLALASLPLYFSVRFASLCTRQRALHFLHILLAARSDSTRLLLSAVAVAATACKETTKECSFFVLFSFFGCTKKARIVCTE